MNFLNVSLWRAPFPLNEVLACRPVVLLALRVWLAKTRKPQLVHNDIGTPRQLGETALLLEGDLCESDRAGIVRILDRSCFHSPMFNELGVSTANRTCLAKACEKSHCLSSVVVARQQKGCESRASAQVSTRKRSGFGCARFL